MLSTEHVMAGLVGSAFTAVCMYGPAWIKAFYAGFTENHSVRTKAELEEDAQEHSQTVQVYDATVKLLKEDNDKLKEKVELLQQSQLECERRDAAQGKEIEWLKETLKNAMARIAELEAANRTRTFNEEDRQV